VSLVEFIDQLRWRPTIGDPSAMGWLTVFGYIVAAISCGRTALQTPITPGPARNRRLTWLVMTAVMAALALNKQLDLQSLLTDIGRVAARHQGWYAERRSFQKWLVLGTLALSGLTVSFLIFRFQTFWKQNVLLAVGIALLTTFIIVRAISFHHVDTLLKTKVVGIKLNWAFELGGIAIITLAAIRTRRTGA
jgi:hypothetical protein